MKCSFCEAALACKHCGKPFRTRKSETHVAVYQRDMEIHCPECRQVLTCKVCNFVYGDPEQEEGEAE